MKRLGAILLGGFWFFLCFLMGVKLFFPSDAVGKRLAYGVNQSTNGAFSLVMDDLESWTLSGLTAEDVQILRHKKPKKRRRSKEEQPVKTSLFAELDSISARFQLLPLLGGSKLLTLEGSAYSGKILGTLGQDGKMQVLDFAAKNLDLREYPAKMSDGEDLMLDGKFNLVSDLRLHQEDIKKSTGDVKVNFDNLAILNEAFADSFEKAEIFFKGDNKGKLVVKKGEFKGEKIRAVVSGDIKLHEKIGRSRLDLRFRVDLDKTYDLLAKVNFRRARDKQGTYHFKCTGTLEKKRCGPDRQAARGRKGRTTRTRRGISGASEDDDNDRFEPGEIDDEARERRKKRSRERRKRARERRERGEAGERVRPDPSRRRRGNRDDDRPELLSDDIPEEEPPFEDDLSPIEFGDMDIDGDPEDFDGEDVEMTEDLEGDFYDD